MPNKNEYNHIPAVIRSLRKEDDQLAYNMAEYMMGKAMVYAPYRTGHLAAEIRTERVRDGHHMVVSSTADATHREYAEYNEYGTRYMRAQPYMMPAYADGIGHMPEEGNAFGERIDRVARTGKAT